jgi:16S rRNA (adenine1518-N6/adenine1519-N6)-dimethyltransferase
MTLSEMRQILSSGQIQLTKSLGQNFLHDGNQLRRIARAAELTSADHVLEIGPGLGPLTELLIKEAGHVLAIEKDRRLFDFLAGRFAGCAKLELIHGDALDWLRENKRDWSGWKLVANLPYSVASPILVELALAPSCPERLVATLQLEVARRIVAKPREEDYGMLTLFLQLQFEPRDWFKIPASCFFPPPDVDSACISLVRRKAALLPPGQTGLFVRLVKQSFSQRRKMMLKLLKQEWPADALEHAFEKAGLSSQARAEEIALEQFVQLTTHLHHDLP